MRDRMLGSLIMLLLVISSCKKVEKLTEPLKAEDLANVSYGAHVSNAMDVYLPANRDANTKVVVLLHGGSWYTGDKSEFTEYAKMIRNRGFAVINMNYRLTHTSDNFRVADQQNDIKEALNFVVSKAGEWNISSNRIALMGASAGAHLALLYTYANNADNKVKTVVALAAPSNLTDTRNVNLNFAVVVEWLIGSSLMANPQAYLNASPVAKVSAGSKPTLLFHGREDVVVPVQQSIDLKAKLDEAGVSNKLVIYENTGHEVIALDNVLAFVAEVDAWLKVNL